MKIRICKSCGEITEIDGKGKPSYIDKGAEIFAYKHGLRLNRSDYLRYLIKEQSDDQRKKY
jgi:hypothetical protein